MAARLPCHPSLVGALLQETVDFVASLHFPSGGPDVLVAPFQHSVELAVLRVDGVDLELESGDQFAETVVLVEEGLVLALHLDCLFLDTHLLLLVPICLVLQLR